MHRGYIKLWRKSFENEFHPSQMKRPYTKWEAWEYLLMHANHKKKWWCGLEFNRGELGYSIVHYASEWRWGLATVWRFLEHLKKRKAIEKVNEKITIRISILNYDIYQNDIMQSGKVNGKISESERKASGKQAETTKECKNEKNKERGGRFTPPSLSDVQKYIKEKKYNVDAESFIAFYSAKGWMIGKNKMKDWRAAIVTWAKRNPALQSTAAQIRTETPTRTNNNQPRWQKRPPEVDKEINKLTNKIGA